MESIRNQVACVLRNFCASTEMRLGTWIQKIFSGSFQLGHSSAPLELGGLICRASTGTSFRAFSASFQPRGQTEMTLPTQTINTGRAEPCLGRGAAADLSRVLPRQGPRPWAAEVPGLGPLASLGMVCSPLGKEADTPGRVPPRDAGLGLRAGDTAWAGTRGVGVVVSIASRGRGGESLGPWVGRSRVQSRRRPPNPPTPGLLALRERGAGWRATPQRAGMRSIEGAGAGCQAAEERGVGWGGGRAACRGPPRGGAGAVGRVCLWTRRAPRSLGPPRLPFRSRRQALQAALSPPPRAFSPVRSRARAARGAGRRRREQPVV